MRDESQYLDKVLGLFALQIKHMNLFRYIWCKLQIQASFPSYLNLQIIALRILHQERIPDLVDRVIGPHLYGAVLCLLANRHCQVGVGTRLRARILLK